MEGVDIRIIVGLCFLILVYIVFLFRKKLGIDKLSFLELLNQIKIVVNIIDTQDEKVLNILEKLSSLSFIPPAISIAIKLLKQFEPMVVIGILSAIEFAEKTGGKSEEKQRKAEKDLTMDNKLDVVVSTVGLINSIVKAKSR